MSIRRQIWTVALILVAMLALASSQCFALTVEIIAPNVDPLEVVKGTDIYFEAVAYDEAQEDVTNQVTWLWDFGDNETSDQNPTEHAYENVANYTVTVTGTLGEEQDDDTMSVVVQDESGPTGDYTIVLAQETDPPPGVTTIAFEAASKPVCHVRYLLVLPAEGVSITSLSVSYKDEEKNEQGKQYWRDWINEDGEYDFWYHGETYGGNETGLYMWISHAFHNDTFTWKFKFYVQEGAEGGYWVETGPKVECQVRNTALETSPQAVLLLDPEGEDAPAQADISWDIEHAMLDGLKFDLWVEIFNLAGNCVYRTEPAYPDGPGQELRDQEASGSWTWHGELTGEGSASKGIYTYKVRARCAPHPVYSCTGCEDQDKSEQLVISDVDTHIWDVDLEEAKVTFSVWYYLNQDANGMGVRVYNPQLECVFAQAGFPANAGTHHSLQYEFPIDQASFGGHYWVVLYGWESADAAQSNRDRAIKRALQKGTMEFIAPVVEAKCTRDAYEGWHDWRPARVDQRVYFKGFEHGFGGMSIIRREWHSGYGDWYEVEAGEEASCTYGDTGDQTATYRVTYVHDLGSQATVQDTCDVTVFSLACGDIWFFDVETPPENYPDTTTFVASGATTGRFHWQVVSGTDKVDLENGNDSVGKDDANSVEVYATTFSAQVDDVEIEFSYRRTEDEVLVSVGSELLSVFTAEIYQAVWEGDFVSENGNGYETKYAYVVTTRPRAGPSPSPLPYALPVNESFGDDGSLFDGENWERADPNAMLTFLDGGYPGHYIFRDSYGASGGLYLTPSPVVPWHDHAEVEVYWREQEYRAGSMTSGKGILLRPQHVIIMRRGCADGDPVPDRNGE